MLLSKSTIFLNFARILNFHQNKTPKTHRDTAYTKKVTKEVLYLRLGVLPIHVNGNLCFIALQIVELVNHAAKYTLPRVVVVGTTCCTEQLSCVHIQAVFVRPRDKCHVQDAKGRLV